MGTDGSPRVQGRLPLLREARHELPAHRRSHMGVARLYGAVLVSESFVHELRLRTELVHQVRTGTTNSENHRTSTRSIAAAPAPSVLLNSGIAESIEITGRRPRRRSRGEGL